MNTQEEVSPIKDYEREAEKRLEVFVRAYVSKFEEKLEEYAKEAEVGGTAKSGKIANRVLGPVATAVGASAGAFVLGGVGASVGKGVGEKGIATWSTYFSGKDHRKKAKKITHIFQNVKTDELREMFVEAGSLIYYSFQKQFESVTDADGNWKRALSKLAIDARNRSISYLYDVETTVAIEALSRDLLTKAVILGESKDSYISHLTPKPMQQCVSTTRPGHTVIYESKEWKTSDIYEKAGIKVVGSNGQTKYYKKEMCGNDYGYRWAFDWENDGSWISTYEEEDCSNVSEDPRTSLKLEELKEKMVQILANLNMEDPKWLAKDNKLQFDRIEDGVDTVKTLQEKVVEDIVPIKQDISEIKTKLSSELPNPRTSLKIEELKGKVDQVLTNINKDEPKLQLDRIESGVDETKETLQTVQQEVIEAIVPIKQDLHEIKTKFSSELRVPKSVQPKIFTVKEPVKTFTGRELELTLLHDELQTQQKQVVVSQCASISGLGGMGKSELARKYAHTYHESYGSCIWIDSETQSSITQSFHGLAEKLQIPIKQKSSDKPVERNILLIVEDIYERFSRSKSLFIFDNVNEYEEIKDYLPSNLSPTDERPTIIITSRNSDWDIGDEGNVGLILLDHFTPEEALSFVKKVLEIKEEDKSHDSLISELTNELCCFPLALRQAASYIKARKFLNSAIENYLGELRDEKKKRDLLKYKTKRDRYTETTYTTWQITFRNIERNETNGPLAIRLVEIMAYLVADDIPLKKFIELEKNYGNLNEAVDILIKYSIITVKEQQKNMWENLHVCSYEKRFFYVWHRANIHRLVQQVIRLWLQDGKRDEDVLRTALTQIHDNVPEDHQAALWSFACNYTTLIDNYFSRIHEESILYKEFIYALVCLVKDGNTRTIQKILNYLEGMTDWWREICSHILEMNFIACRHNDQTHIKAVVLFHAEVYNALKHSKTKDLELFLQSFDKSLINSSFDNYTALIKSAHKGNLNVVKILVENGADVNSPCVVHSSALQMALRENHPQIADYLLDHGADSNAINNSGWTVLESASYYGNLKVVKRLVNTIANCGNGTDAYWKPLHLAAQNNQVEIVEFLVNHEVYRSAMKDHGQTVCRIAANFGRIQVVKYLIENKLANVNGRDYRNDTLLIEAVRYYQFDMVKYLLSDETPDKVDIDAYNVLGFTPLFQAVLRKNVHIARFLVEHGAAVDNVQNGNTLLGQLSISALHLAVACNCLEIVKLLVEKCNADINTGLNTTFSPFQIAKFFDNKKLCEFLIRNGADTTQWSKANLQNITLIAQRFCQENSSAVDSMFSACTSILDDMTTYYSSHLNQSSRLKKKEIFRSFLKQFVS